MAKKAKESAEKKEYKRILDMYGFYPAAIYKGKIYEFFEMIPKNLVEKPEQSTEEVKDTKRAMLRKYRERYPSRTLIMITPHERMNVIQAQLGNGEVGALIYRLVDGIFTLYTHDDVLELD